MTTQVLDEPENQTPAPTTAPDAGMTEEEFLQKFQEIAPHFTWRIEREKLVGYPNEFRRILGCLRLVVAGVEVGIDIPDFCPITAVARILTGRYYDRGNYNLAAEAIELPRNPTNRIASAADLDSALNHQLRQRLSQIAGVK